jgi:hypothetical protein
MIIDGVSPVDLKYHPDFNIMLNYLQTLFAKRALSIMKKYNVYKIEKLQKDIIYAIIGYNPEYSELAIDKELYNVLLEWMELQDPIFGKKGYP